MWREVSAPTSIDAKELLNPISTFRPGAIRTTSVNIAMVAIHFDSNYLLLLDGVLSCI